MKRKISLILSALILCGVLTACGESGTPAADGTTTAASEQSMATLAEEDLEIIGELETTGEKLENPTVKWLSFWDINPEVGKAMPVELELFQQNYGGEIEFISTTWEEKFNTLSTLVASGNSPDMFPAADMDVFPRGVITNLLAPLDDYVDFDSVLWQPMKEVNDLFVFDGKHYVGAISTDAGVICIYNQKTIDENGLPDPAELYTAGTWDWDSFYDMMVEFSDPEDGRYGIDGWWFEGAVSLSTGVPYIGVSEGEIVHNLNNPLIEKVQDYMQNLNRQRLPIPKAEFNWEIQPARIGDGKTLFFPVGIWQLMQADLSDFGENDDIRFVPMPKCPDTDEYYTSIGLSALSMVVDAPNPEGVKAFLECARIAADSDEVKEIQKRQFFEEYGWTQNMYDSWLLCKELTLASPVVEYYTAVNATIEELINNPMKKSYNEGASWTQTKEEIIYGVEAELEKANTRITE